MIIEIESPLTHQEILLKDAICGFWKATERIIYRLQGGGWIYPDIFIKPNIPLDGNIVIVWRFPKSADGIFQ